MDEIERINKRLVSFKALAYMIDRTGLVTCIDEIANVLEVSPAEVSNICAHLARSHPVKRPKVFGEYVRGFWYYGNTELSEVEIRKQLGI